MHLPILHFELVVQLYIEHLWLPEKGQDENHGDKSVLEYIFLLLQNPKRLAVPKVE